VRIYFHLKDAHEVILDDEGVEVSGTREARIQARLAIEELQEEDPRNWSEWTLEATDAAGRVLFTLDLDSTV
jgi:hypothetical protein